MGAIHVAGAISSPASSTDGDHVTLPGKDKAVKTLPLGEILL